MANQVHLANRNERLPEDFLYVRKLSPSPYSHSYPLPFCAIDGNYFTGLSPQVVEMPIDKYIDDALNFVAEKGWTLSSKDFFEALVRYLGETFNLDYVLLAHLKDDNNLETIVIYAHGNIAPNITYELTGTPCENVASKEFCFYPQNIQNLFPADHLLAEMNVNSYAGIPLWNSQGQASGLLATLNQQEIENIGTLERVLKIVSARAGAELERKLYEEALVEKQEQLRMLLDSAAEAIYGIDQKGNCTFCNRSALKVLGYPSEDKLVGRNMHDLIHHSYADGTTYNVEDCNIYKSFQTGQKIHSDDEVMWRADGSSFATEYWSHPIVKNGQTVGSVVTFLDISQRKKTEEALKVSEERFRRIFNDLSIGMALCDESGKFLRINKAFTNITGYSSEEVTGLTFAEITSAAFHAEEAKLFKDLTEGVTSSYKIEKQCIHKDGNAFWASVNATRLISSESSPPLYIGSIENIDKDKKLEISYRQTRNRLESLWKISRLTNESFQNICDNVLNEIVVMTNSPYGFYGFLDQDEEVMTIFSWSKEAMRDCAIHNQPIKFPIERSGIWGNAVRTKRPFILNDYRKEAEFKTGTPEGHVSLSRVLSVPVISSGKVVAVSAVANKDGDYTEDDIEQLTAFLNNVQVLIDRKNVQDYLEDQKEYYRALFKGSPHPTAVADAESGILLACNNRFSDLLGYSNEEVVGQHQSKFHRAKPGECELTENFRAHKTDANGKSLQDQLITKDGRLLDVEITASKLNLKDRTVLLGFFHDVTERNMMLKERQRSSQLAALGTLAAGVAHEINNPIQGILNYASLIEKNVDSSERIRKASARIIQESQRIASITKNLLSYSRENRLVMSRSKVDQIIYDALSLISTKIRNFGISLDVDVSPDLPEVYWQFQSIQQVILNLVDNAAQALSLKENSREGKKIHLKAHLAEKQDKKFIHIMVKDNGTGMSQETIDRAAEPFFTTKPSDMGTGLGLYIVNDIISMHSGTILIESKEGDFTKIDIEIPVTPDQAPSAAKTWSFKNA